MTTTARRRWPWLAVALAVVLVAVGGGLLVRQRSQAAADDALRAAANRYATALSRRDLSGVAFTGSTGAARQQVLAAQLRGLGPGHPTVRTGSVRRSGASATSTLDVAWTLPGGARWSYELPLRLTRSGTTWRVAAGQRLAHPQVADGERL